MATPQLSPGIITREVDLTVGRADNVTSNVGAIAGPFAIGPVEEPILVTSETELINTFGKPLSTDSQYEYWMSASSFLTYGGILSVVRADGSTLNNANAGVGAASTTDSKIKNYDNYNASWSGDSVNFYYAAKNPGSWSNNLKVCVIDDAADQIIGITTTSLSLAGAQVGYGVTAALSATLAGAGSTSTIGGYLKGIITGVTTDSTNGASKINVKITSRVSAAGTETPIDYNEYSNVASFTTTNSLRFVNNSGINTGYSASSPYTPATVTDWYKDQTLGLTNSTVYWSSIAPKPTTNAYSLARNGENDGLHVVVVDDLGSVTGVQGTILEKHVNLSKASDSVSNINSPTKIFYKNYLANNSAYLYAGRNPSAANDSYHGTSPVASGFSTAFTQVTAANGLWNQTAQGRTFAVIGNKTYTLSGGVDYSASGGMTATLGNLSTAYDLFANKNEVTVDFLINGPGLTDEAESQAKANKLISIAESRKDCIACVSPHRSGVVNITNTSTQTTNIIRFFSSLSSSSYAVFDSGYKFTYDRFNDTFRYVPCNADVAGLMVRTGILAFPWFSPAGQQRGSINNTIKLAYNPNKDQRDSLYQARVNAITNTPGAGTILFGDKTALGYQSAFDRINVRRLFITVEKALENAANAQLFEINDETTRAAFTSIVDPFLRDIQSKRGLYDYRVICDSTNNTPDIVDNNEFRADIFLKPVKSINYITLTFVATRTGVAFEEVIGRA
jgi:phage tail sheath protein FI